MKIKFNVVYSDVYSCYIDDEGELEVDNFDGYELFCKMYEKMEGEGSKCGMSKAEFKKSYEVVGMREWIMMKDKDGIEVMNFVKVI